MKETIEKFVRVTLITLWAVTSVVCLFLYPVYFKSLEPEKSLAQENFQPLKNENLELSTGEYPDMSHFVFSFFEERLKLAKNK